MYVTSILLLTVILTEITLYIYVGVAGLSGASILCFKIRASGCVHCKEALSGFFLFTTETPQIYQSFTMRSLWCIRATLPNKDAVSL
jgi:hypothetical protein